MLVQRSKIDYYTIIFYLLLVGIGWISIYISDFHTENIGFRHNNQQLWIGISSIVALIILLINTRIVTDFSYLYYIFMMFTLLAVMIFGQEVNGARAWFQLGSIKVQPSEFAKFVTCLTVARYVGQNDINLKKTRDIVIAGSIVGLPLCFVILQNDVGSALVYCSFFIALYREGLSILVFAIAMIIGMIAIFTIKWGTLVVLLLIALFSTLKLLQFLDVKNRYATLLFLIPMGLYGYLHYNTQISEQNTLFYVSGVFLILFNSVLFYKKIEKNLINHLIKKILFSSIVTLAIAMCFSVSYLFDKLLQAHQKERLLQVIGEAKESYNVMHAKIAIALGGVSGKGFLEGMHTKLDYVPEQETDFIFTTIGENFGFIGSSSVIILFVVFMLRLVYIAERQTSRFSRVYAYGVVGIFFFHFMINIGMVLGLLPVIGIPLPFFSYGGSSLLSFTILLFILIKLDIRREDRVI